MSTVLQCDRRLTGTYSYGDEVARASLSPVSCSAFVDTASKSAISCDLPDPVWNKMSGNSSGVKGKRKKTDSKPQSQLNKCLNEKRRREQENIFIEELAELISISFGDMSALNVKPDKCAILQRTVLQIRSIKEQQELQQKQQNQQIQGVASTDDIQQGEVSSSKPTGLSNEIFGPLLLEALEGFAFLLNHDGRVDYVTDNVSQFIKFTKDEILGKNIYSIIHPKDHVKFSSCLLPTSIGNRNQGGSGGGSSQQPKNRPFNCSMLIKSGDDFDESVADNKEHKYEEVQISSTLVKGDSGGNGGGEVTSESLEMGPGLICVARRIPSTEKHLSAPFEQFSMKLDIHGKIIGVDTSGTSIYTSYIDKKLMIGELVQNFCHHQDLQKLNMHLKNTLKNETDMSKIFRFKLAPDKFIPMQTKSRLFPATGSSPSSEDFIMTTYSIIDDREVCQMIESSVPHSQLNPTSSSPGGPPLYSALNGRLSTVTTPETSNAVPMNSNADYPSYSLANDTYDTDFFGHNSYGFEEQSWNERPDSRHSQSSVASPANPFGHASPATNPPSTPFSGPLPFSPVEKETKDGQESLGADMKPCGGDKGTSDRLRNLLLRSSSETEQDANHRSIEDYFGAQQDESMELGDTGPSPGPQRKSVTPTTPNSSSSNHMLLSLLNKKPECGNDIVSEMIMHPRNEDKHPNMMENDMHSQNQSRMLLGEAENGLMRELSLPFNATSPPTGSNGVSRKRHSEDGDDGSVPSKRGPAPLESIPPPVPASSRSNLQEKNKMLASLLAKEPSAPPQVPHVPPSFISATPQDRLNRVLSNVTTSTRVTTSAISNASVQMTQQNQTRIMAHRQVTPSNINTSSPFLNDLLQGVGVHSQSSQQQLQQLHSRPIQHQLKITNNNNNINSSNNNMMPYDSELTFEDGDEQLHEILEYIASRSVNENLDSGEVCPNASDVTVVSNNVTLNNLIDNSSNAEKLSAINAITRSFMLVEQTTRTNRLPLPQQVVLQQHQQLPMQQQQVQSPINQPSSPFQHPPPTYQPRANRMPMHPNVARMPARPPVPQYPHAASNPQFQQSTKYLAQEQKRLMQQQQQQEFSRVVSNATVNSSSNTSLQNINLSTVPPPNVSLQPRTNNLPSESPNAQQLSPGGNPAFGSPLLPAPQISPSQRQQPAYSPLGTNHSQPSFQSLNGSFNGATTQHSPQPQGARLSPSGGIPSFQPQLSPRISQAQTSYATSVMTSQGAQQVQQQNAWQSPQHQPPPQQQQQPQQVQQSQQQQQQQQQLVNSRLSMQQQQQQQQQNALLEARLSGGGVYAANQRTASVAATAGMFTQQPQKSQQAQSPQLRGLTSPGARQSPFPADISPTTATSYNTVANQQYRMPRSMSVTSTAPTMATAQVPGGNNCIRSYPNMGPSLSLKDNSQNTSPHPPPLYTHTSMMYQHHGDTSPYGYPDQSLPMYGDRSRLSHSSGPHNANNNTNNSEFVRSSIRAMVGARQQSVPLQVAPNQTVDLDSLGLSFEMPQHENDPQRWGNLSGDGSEGSPSTGLPGRPSMDDVMRSSVGGNPNNMNSMGSVSGEKSSLLQKLLSE